MRKLIYLLAGTVVFGSALSGAMPSQNQVASINSFLATASARPAANKQLPQTKQETINVGGQRREITVRLYDQYRRLFTTYYPDKYFDVNDHSGGEGTKVRFVAEQNSFVNIVFPKNIDNLAELREFVGGKNGVIRSQGWEIVSRDRSLPYSWATEKIELKKRPGIKGAIYLGRANGRVFYVVVQNPVDISDRFEARVRVILRNLQVGG